MIGVSVDPGDPHTGLAVWLPTADGGWYCDRGSEVLPDDYVDRLWNSIDAVAWVAMEAFYLFGDKAMAQTGSSFPMVELIGFARNFCRLRGVPFATYSPGTRDATFQKAVARGYKFPRDPDGHVKSAVSVGLCHVGWTARNHQPDAGVGTPLRTGTLDSVQPTHTLERQT